MHLYWRIIGELSWMGETVVIHDPSLKRCFAHWLRIHSEAIWTAEGPCAGEFASRAIRGMETPSLN